MVLFRLCHLSKQKFFQYTCHGRPISIETRAIVNTNQLTVRLNYFNNRSLCKSVLRVVIVYLGRRRPGSRILRREEAYSIMNGSFVVPNSLCVCMSDFFLCQRQYGSVWLFLIHSTHHTTHCHNHKIISLPSNNSRQTKCKR